jgi:hypothetical protein
MASQQVTDRCVARLIRLAFLAPEIVGGSPSVV